ncbi:sigma-70 family RNA polymerase sigma factor [Phragmitibacter flavus]|uniref:Sigma-70 family RNA polymerase sigma factor n=1 Tax=Phragmitibacter flavus TaxID=2576071 RepID=A0A5R8K8C2_9BACT|nr:sigma-70 family RNA polymerase sigma factor [Phragmitibacter flavus]TLD68205.1 sigma-70 family RNA polymerase sigma factor [Phragmitibacter flavus]
MVDPSSHSSTENLVLLLTQHQDQLFRYIFSLVPREADARDILQETSLALFRKLDQYDPTRPFLPWAYRFAYLQVQRHREKNSRSPLVLFSEDIVDLLASERAHIEPQLEERLHHLDHCLEKLTASEKDLITRRYALRQSAEEIMQHSALTRRTLFRNLEMLRQRLHECVTQQLSSISPS